MPVNIGLPGVEGRGDGVATARDSIFELGEMQSMKSDAVTDEGNLFPG